MNIKQYDESGNGLQRGFSILRIAKSPERQFRAFGFI
jgi:hypothetical protein